MARPALRRKALQRKAFWRYVLSAAAALAIAACGGGGDGGAGPTPPPGNSGGGGGGGGGVATTTITIGSDGRVTPANITVPLGSRVTFVNNHDRPHDMFSDPHPEHSDCPEFDSVGFLPTGQSRQTQPLNRARTCGFHDHNEPSNTALQGSVRIQ